MSLRAVDEQSGYSFDCFLPDISLVVEFDGPHHFAQKKVAPGWGRVEPAAPDSDG
ncbi:hypothetical protein T484DRAFT_1768750 [Baffinella frigidus]|nr:hypothetical protein T484DRAFT_1768750 [Cryptophyta sp. CCMP2293]